MIGKVCAVGMMLAALAVPAQAVPLDTFGNLPNVTRAVISPDGAKIAVVAADPQGQQVRVVKTDDLSLINAFGAGTTKLVGVQWVGPDHLIVIYSQSIERFVRGRSEPWLAMDINLKTGKVTRLLDANLNAAVNVIGGWPQPAIIDGRPIVFLVSAGILRDDLDTNRVSQVRITRLVDDIYDAVVTQKGDVIAQAAYDQHYGKWSLWTRTTGDWTRRLLETDPIDTPELGGLNDKGDALIVEKDENGVPRYHSLSLAGGDLSPPIATLDGASLVYDPANHTVIGGEIEEPGSVRYSFFDRVTQTLWDAIVRAFPGEVVRLASWSEDWSKVILRVEGPKSGAAFYLLDTRTRHADWIADKYTGVTGDNISPVRTIHYAAADGTDIPAYLTLPRGAPPKSLPLVVLAHGGPEGHDAPGFDWWSQGLASLGYAVLQPQFRGSDNVSAGFIAAGYGQWGRKMQTDLSDGVRYLAQNGTIDPNRVCIAGASYGGYAAMAGVTLQAGIYRCAIAVAGISDIQRQLGYYTVREWGTDNIVHRYWYRFLGAKGDTDPIIKELSPIHHLDKLTVPLLLIHGSIDPVVEPAQSRLMLEAATKAGKLVHLVTLTGEDHNLAHGATRLEMLQVMAEFLKTNLPTTAPPAQ